ncbi:MAG: RpiB/LacA/LacB family sugar-phosphate isomerase [Natronospirillum sp.]
MTIGARVVGIELAKSIVDAFLESEFDSQRSGSKVDRIQHYEKLESNRA